MHPPAAAGLGGPVHSEGVLAQATIPNQLPQSLLPRKNARVLQRFVTGAAGAILVAGLSLFWLTIAARTLHGAWHGYLFHTPCLRAENWTDTAIAPA
jgi:hypothetical protein